MDFFATKIDQFGVFLEITVQKQKYNLAILERVNFDFSKQITDYRITEMSSPMETENSKDGTGKEKWQFTFLQFLWEKFVKLKRVMYCVAWTQTKFHEFFQN